ncbi:MAG: hypothetical protein HQL54_00685 [Magnetococcales bacterium]|nr:hypothetical protein [Magnetococcales bacterium]
MRIVMITILMLFTVSASAVEIAPRISDREIIESLSTLKQGQKDINKRFDDVNKRIDDVNKRFDGVNKRFDDVNNRIDDVNKRFDGVNKRIDDLRSDINERFTLINNNILALFGTFVTLIVALFGYIAWDRRTMMKPVQERLERLERDLHHDLDLQHPEGSRLTRLLNALRKQAGQDEKMAALLRSFSLL